MKKTKKAISKLLTKVSNTVNKSKAAHKQIVAKIMSNKIITEDGVGRHDPITS